MVSNTDIGEKTIIQYIFIHSTPWDIESEVLVATAAPPFAGVGETGDEASRPSPGVLLLVTSILTRLLSASSWSMLYRAPWLMT